MFKTYHNVTCECSDCLIGYPAHPSERVIKDLPLGNFGPRYPNAKTSTLRQRICNVARKHKHFTTRELEEDHKLPRGGFMYMCLVALVKEGFLERNGDTYSLVVAPQDEASDSGSIT